MWSPTNRSDFHVPAGPSLRSVLILGCLLALCLSACGYQLASRSESILGDGTKTIKIKGIDYPTLHPWLPNSIRSSLRDEIGARYLARWVDSGSADYEIQINVESFTSREWIRTEWDTSQMFSISIVLSAVIYDGSTNKEVWNSGSLYYSEYEETSDERGASGNIITQICRRLADKMRETF